MSAVTMQAYRSTYLNNVKNLQYLILDVVRGVFRVGNSRCVRTVARVSSCPPARISAADSGRIYVKFDIGNSYENLLRNFKFSYNRTKYRALYMNT